MLLNLTDPIADTLKGSAIGNVIHEDDTLSTAEVGCRDGPEPLLAGRVPYLQFDPLSVDFNVFNFEINSNRRNKGGREGVVRISQEETGFPHT